jgi:ABC-type tungstate transport system substrate-binding protein
VNAFVTAGAGFLAAVLWFDLMFDVQAARQPPGDLPEQTLASIASYYARVTTAARPMNRLIALTMLATLAAIVVEVVEGFSRAWVPWCSLALALGGIVTAGARTVPSAVRLGTRRDTTAEQSELARAVLAQHVFCFSCIASLIALQLAAG